MAENVQETKPPEPPPKPPEVPKPTEQSSRSADKDHQQQPQDSQQSAQQDARNAAQSEHAKATGTREPDGLRPTPEFQAGLDQHTAAKNGPENLRPTPEFRSSLDEHTAAKAGRDGVAQEDAPQDTPKAQEETPNAHQDAANAQRPDPSSAARDRETASPRGEQASEQAAARQSAATEHAKAANPEAAPDETRKTQTPSEDASRPQTPPHDAAHPQDPETTAEDDNLGVSKPGREIDQSPETAARLSELRNEGHGPQRHHDPTDDQLTARMGDPVFDPDTGKPKVNEQGFVEAENYVDPITGTTQDGVHPDKTHKCGDYAARFDSGDDFVAADRFMRDRIGAGGSPVQRVPIEDVLGPQGHERMSGYSHDPETPGKMNPADFEGGTVFALYKRGADGELKLHTMYPDPPR